MKTVKSFSHGGIEISVVFLKVNSFGIKLNQRIVDGGMSYKDASSKFDTIVENLLEGAGKEVVEN